MIKKILLSLFMLYTLLGFFVIPFVLEMQIPKIVSNQLHAKLSIKDISFNPFLFHLDVYGVELQDEREQKLASFEVFRANFEPHLLFVGSVYFKNITLQKPQIFLNFDKEGKLNFDNLVKNSTQNEPNKTRSSSELPHIVIDTVALEDGSFALHDLRNPTPFELVADAINLKVSDIDTQSFDAKSAKVRLTSRLGDGGSVDVRGDIASYDPFIIDGNVNIEATQLYTFWKYMQDCLKLEIADGKLFFVTNYHFNAADINATTLENLFISLENLRVKPKSKNHDLLTLKTLRLEDVRIKPMRQELFVQDIIIESLSANAKRDTQGNIDWIGYLEAKQQSAKEQKPQKENAPWSAEVAKISLNGIGALFEDKSITPSVKTKMDVVNAEIKNVTLLGEEALTYKADVRLGEAACNFQGLLKHKNLMLDSSAKCSNLGLLHYVPYIDKIALEQLKTYNVALKGGVVGFNAHVAIEDKNAQISTVIDKADLKLENFHLAKRKSGEKVLAFKTFTIQNASIDTAKKEAHVATTTLEKLSFGLKKEKNGLIDVTELVELKEVKKGAEANIAKDTPQEKPYRVAIGAFDMNDAEVIFEDKSVQNSAKVVLDKIHAGAKNIDSNAKSTLAYAIDMRVNKVGKIDAKGSLQHTPLEQKGTLRLQKISLKELTPYLQESTFLKISDGYLTLNSKNSYKQRDEKFDASVDGSLNVRDFFLHDTRDNSTIASFVKADVNSFAFKSTPNRLSVDEVLLDSFYVDAQINEDKSMNLAKLTKEMQEPKKETKKEVVQQKEPFDARLLKLKVKNGSANFADYSLPIDFKTSIHDLNGDIYALSNIKGGVSYVEMDGEVDAYGSAKLKGSVEASDFKSYMDLNLNFRNLSLNSFSGYSAQFAGYKIDEGKFFLDLQYKIFDSQLLGENSLIIKKIKLGEEIEDENITKLPLGFAVALLEDSEGVIDINMPVDGDLSKPDFKYGAMVLKTFANLIIKAVASPFKFLGAALGIKSDELEFIEFGASEFGLLPPEREKLDNIAKILHEKPKLSLKISGGYDTQKDKEAIQAKKLTEEVIKQGNDGGSVSVNSIEMLCIPRLGKEKVVSLRAKIGEKYHQELFRAEFQKALVDECMTTWSVLDEELVALANSRADTIATYLIGVKNVDATKVVVEKVQKRDDTKEQWVKSTLRIDAL
ncbi:MAG: DUF748 domain-containing protein [Sulfurimonas sp.]|uniref:DUF748 domain-containing protein n=1 Tax=Sulfurimonas sp. TaxID=2022749 RepID=UPI00262E5E7E|nr:DUF748 domain-containing protein [Sulfurimonas sp.]MDD2653239.1 DUF748 domain-containing protein [Sulfurimonas sp.]MDD3452298.1 DUF748 domain-containing protein [Sulfurimonas sp.]